VTNPDYFTVSVDKDAVGYAIDTEFFVWITFTVGLPVVLNAGPSFGLYVVGKLFLVLVSAESNNPDILPVSWLVMLFKHFLVVCHWRLTWRAPSSPKVKKDYLPRLMFHSWKPVSSKVAQVLKNSHVFSDTFLDCYI